MLIGGLPWSDLRERIATAPDYQKEEWYTNLPNEEKAKLENALAAQRIEDANTQTGITGEQMPEESKETAIGDGEPEDELIVGRYKKGAKLG